MLSIGIIYPNFKILQKFENIIELNYNSKTLYSTLELTNFKNQELCLEILKNSQDDNENDYGLILTDKNGKNKAYLINNIEIISNEKNKIIINAFILKQTRGIFKIWKNFFENSITEFNQWKKIKESEKQAWLELALSFQNIDYAHQKSTIEINGIKINSLNDFFCNIGEALNGKGGYFGRNFHAFFDCLRSPEFGTENFKTLIWHNHKQCKWKLKKNFNDIIKLLEEFKIDVELK